uniref:Uncharacterized protein n=2 Tax=Entomoneis paludosa TaxID=265537 RepID=A0A7S3DQM5_9STRA|mmetsp:Transcript_28538/g.59603  ORF Transcript_28538/g.59603 Transcript_28538/m.59603 type:complete len:322 (+) Transcript_28538:375-1340(+)
MNGWAKARGDPVTNAEHVQALFDRHVQHYQTSGQRPDCRPNHVAYATLIHAWTKTRTVSAAYKAEGLLQQMYVEFQKDEEADSNSKNKLGADRIIPNTQLITSVMDCWQKSGAPEAGQRAESLLQWMIVRSQEQSNPHVAAMMRPNAHSFSAVIAAWARTRQAGKAARARKVLTLMSQMHAKGQIVSPPNTYCYTNVLNSCAYCIQEDDEKKASLAIAVQTYKELLNHADPTVQPTDVTFSTFLTALRNLLPSDDKRTSAVRTVFEAAQERGQVSHVVVQKLQSVLPKKDYEELIPSSCREETTGHVLADQIPAEWKRNVV